MTQDYYEILQAHPKADRAAIDAAYARLRDLYDPAQLDGAAELVALARRKRDAIERAYAVLGDPSARRLRRQSRRAAPPMTRSTTGPCRRRAIRMGHWSRFRPRAARMDDAPYAR